MSKRKSLTPKVSYNTDDKPPSSEKKHNPKSETEKRESNDNDVPTPSSQAKSKQQQDKKKNQTKVITFKFINPKTKKDEMKQISIERDTTIAQIIQIFNEHLKIDDIIGFKSNGADFLQKGNLKYSETSLYYEDNSKDIEISFIFNRVSQQSTTVEEVKAKKQNVYIIYITETKTVQIDFSDPAPKVFDYIYKNDSFPKKKSILYFPGGNMMTTSFNDFIKKNGKCKKFLYAININKSKFDPKEADDIVDISTKSINSLFPDLKDKKYVCLLCCILKYINMKLYKSLHTIKSFFDTVNFTPFLTSLHCIYNDKVTKLALFTVTSFLQSYAPNTERLKSLFSTMSSYLRTNNNNNLKAFENSINNDYSFNHDYNYPPQLKESNCFNKYTNVWDPISVTTPKQLYSRKYWSIVEYNNSYVLCNFDLNGSDPSKPSNEIIVYDPTNTKSFFRMNFDELSNPEKGSTKSSTNKIINHRPYNPDIKFSQATISIIDHSASMIACIDENGIRRSKVAVDIINKFIQTGKNLSVNDPFVLFDSKCREAEFPLIYKKEEFRKPSRVYDRINMAIYYLKSEQLAKNLADGAYKRIFLVSDGTHDASDTKKYDILKDLCESHIILDVILLKEGEISKDLCALSHLSGGDYYLAKNYDDAIFISQYKKLVQISGKEKLLNFQYSYISNEKFDNISENMRIKNTINDIRIKNQEDFYADSDLYSPFSVVRIKNDLQGKRIQKEIDICAYYQQYMQSLGKEPFFMIYRRFFDNTNIDIEKVIVFIKGNPKSSYKVIHQVMISFTYYYPFEMPIISLISLSKIDEKMPNDNFLFDEPYKPEMRLLYILNKIYHHLNCIEEPSKKDNNLDPIDSLDQIEGVFRIYNGKTRKFKSYDKYVNLK